MITDHTLTQMRHHSLTQFEVEVGTLTLLSTATDESDLQDLSGVEELSSAVWQIESQRTTIGSLSSANIRIEHPTVSRKHAQIEVDSRGYRIIDAGSKNGVMVNQVKVLNAFLRDGDLVSIGGVKLLFQLNDERSNAFTLWSEDSFGELYGSSELMRELFALLHRISLSEANVLIQGESGTGKELAARAIHQYSKRARAPFIVFDCSSVPANLIESELFGHVKGAFTGAQEPRRGSFLSAEGGTLFLDEIGELPLELQPKLLRVLERREYKPVGGDEYFSSNVRVICATHRDLNAEVLRQVFRLDLFYRLAVVTVTMPPLKEHPEDIPGLVERIIHQFHPTSKREISYKTMNLLLQHQWNGNVRELKNYVQRAIALSDPKEPQLETQFLIPPSVSAQLDSHKLLPLIDQNTDEQSIEDGFIHLNSTVNVNQDFKSAKSQLIEEFERSYWIALMNKFNHNLSAAARVAGIHRKSAEYIIKKLNLKRESDS